MSTVKHPTLQKVGNAANKSINIVSIITFTANLIQMVYTLIAGEKLSIWNIVIFASIGVLQMIFGRPVSSLNAAKNVVNSVISYTNNAKIKISEIINSSLSTEDKVQQLILLATQGFGVIYSYGEQLVSIVNDTTGTSQANSILTFIDNTAKKVAAATNGGTGIVGTVNKVAKTIDNVIPDAPPTK